jgi:hypothetical protein
MTWLRTCLQTPFKTCSAVLTELRLLSISMALWGRDPFTAPGHRKCPAPRTCNDWCFCF